MKPTKFTLAGIAFIALSLSAFAADRMPATVHIDEALSVVQRFSCGFYGQCEAAGFGGDRRQAFRLDLHSGQGVRRMAQASL